MVWVDQNAGDFSHRDGLRVGVFDPYDVFSDSIVQDCVLLVFALT